MQAAGAPSSLQLYTCTQGHWEIERTLIPDDAGADAFCGESLVIGPRTLVTAVFQETENRTAVCVFCYDGTGWRQQQELPIPGLTGKQPLAFALQGDLLVVRLTVTSHRLPTTERT